MLIFLRHGYTAKQLKILNLCRMWTCAITLADITTGDGRFIQPQCLTITYRRPSAGRNWPKTEPPDAHCWHQWTTALQTCFLRMDDRHNRLNRPLGYWINEPPHLDWYYSPSTNTLFERRTDNHWDTRIRNTGQQPARFQGFCTTPQTLPTFPPDANPTTVYSTQIRRHQGTQPIQQIDVTTTEKAWWNELVHLPDDIAPLVNGIMTGTAICVTDGLYKTKYGTAALIILSTLEAPDGVTLVNQTPGELSDQDAYRAKWDTPSTLHNSTTSLTEKSLSLVTAGRHC
jgi:hypothetical protein